jgi:hypothetical protein
MLYPTEQTVRGMITDAVTWVVFAATGVLALAVIF